MSHLPWWGVIWKLFVPLVVAASAQSITIADVPTTLDQNAESQVSVSFSCPGCSTDSYLRAVFYPSGTSYFGYTQNNDGAWTNAPGGSCTQYYKVLQTDLSKEGTWSGVLKIKPDPTSQYYNGPGEYMFKVGRYTPSCSSASVWSSEMTIAITGPTHTPTPAPSATAAPTTMPNPTATRAPVPSEVPSSTPTMRIAPIPADEINPDILGGSVSADSIDEAKNVADAPDESTISGSTIGQSPLVISFLCIGLGLALLSFATAWKNTDIWKKLVAKQTQ